MNKLYEVTSEIYVPFDNGVLWTCTSGPKDGEPVLLCNGGPGCCDYLVPVAEMLADKRVIRFEQRGCGRSTADGKYDLLTAIEDMERVRRYYGVEHWIVGGHSWGANLALAYAMTYPSRAAALLYIAGNGIHNDRSWSEEYHRNRDTRGEKMPKMAYAGNAEVNAMGNESLRAFGHAPDFYARVSRLTLPALFVFAEHDIRPAWPAAQLCALMPNAQAVTIPGAAHYLWLDNSEGLKKAFVEFIENLQETTP